jgi:D-alanyl-D-alanine carboxypeptidase
VARVSGAGSLTKPFVATVVPQLVGEARLSISDTVEHWLPGTLPNGDRITVRQLLNHTAGVPGSLTPKRELCQGIASGPGPRASWSRWWQISRRCSVPAARGSNTGCVLAGLIVEAVTRHSLGDELARRIFRPLRLRDTTSR